MLQLIEQLKENGQDYEFYPTTQAMIQTIKRHTGETDTFLDCGAGNGSALDSLTKGTKYAIEKSQILIKEMSPDIYVVGCEFFENSLIDKKVDAIFCNPPYSQYKEWAIKIITEANASRIFLIIPERWKDSEHISAAIKDRKASFSIIGNTDFYDAPRSARAKVDIVKINLQTEKSYSRNTEPDVDPFRLWVEKTFPLNERSNDESELSEKEFKEKINELVPGRNLVDVMVELYGKELQVLQKNFYAISQLDRALFSELKIDFSSMVKYLRDRIKNLKEKYWKEVFNNLSSITDRLTKDSREKLLKTLNENVSVDFNEQNIHAVALWAIKNANAFFDSQLIDVFISLSERANIVKYKSNATTWGADNWRFREEMRNGDIKHFGLDYRCVLTFYNTFTNSSWNGWDYPNGLHRNVNDRLNDIITVANNLGFGCPEWENSLQKQWEPGQAHDFYINRGRKEILMNVRAYKNGNVHIKFNQKFLRKLNVEFGRLKGWLRDHKQAAEELNISEHEAKQYFKTNYVLECSTRLLLQ